MKRMPLVAIAGVVLLTAGCSSPAGNTVEVGGSGTTGCFALDAPAVTLVVGIRTTGDDPVTLTSALIERVGEVEADEAFILQGFANDQGGLEGLTVEDDPPVDLEGWEDRIPVAGAVLEPGTAYSLVVPIDHEAGVSGYVSNVSVKYEDTGDGQSRSADTSAAVGFGESNAGACG